MVLHSCPTLEKRQNRYLTSVLGAMTALLDHVPVPTGGFECSLSVRAGAACFRAAARWWARCTGVGC